MKADPRIVVAGQVPPPMGGQNTMIARVLDDLRSRPDVRTEHLLFRFTTTTTAARKGQFSKFIELLRVIGRLIRLRINGSIDLIVFPPGGPQNVPLIRDILLLPWMLLLSRKVVLHFHAAGIADSIASGNPLARVVAKLYRLCGHAVVMTEFNARDPRSCDIEDIAVIPHTLDDTSNADLIDREGNEIRILAMGHLCSDKGTPVLIKAVAELRRTHPELVLELAGEPLAPYSRADLESDLERNSLAGNCRLLGVLSGDEKQRVFARAHLFVFPSKAPYESFGLVMAEAMMWSLPVTASDWRGNKDVIARSDGGFLYTPPESSEALTHQIRELLNQRSLWPRFGEANRRTYQERYQRQSGTDHLVEHLIGLAQTSDE